MGNPEANSGQTCRRFYNTKFCKAKKCLFWNPSQYQELPSVKAEKSPSGRVIIPSLVRLDYLCRLSISHTNACRFRLYETQYLTLREAGKPCLWLVFIASLSNAVRLNFVENQTKDAKDVFKVAKGWWWVRVVLDELGVWQKAPSHLTNRCGLFLWVRALVQQPNTESLFSSSLAQGQGGARARAARARAARALVFKASVATARSCVPTSQASPSRPFVSWHVAVV